jgi:hypothetical protein
MMGWMLGVEEPKSLEGYIDTLALPKISVDLMQSVVHDCLY